MLTTFLFRRLVPAAFSSAVLLLSLPAVAQPPIRFDAPRNFATCPLPAQVIPMDLDGDGDLDLAVRCTGVTQGPVLQLFENRGDGVPVPRATLPLASATELSSADLDVDGRLDLAQAGTTGLTTGQLATYLLRGPFTFETHTLVLPFASNGVEAGHLDADNVPELIFLDENEQVTLHVYGADGLGSYVARGTADTDLFVLDADANGVTDVQCEFVRTGVAVGDVTGDGIDDVLVTHRLKRFLNPVGTVGEALQGCPVAGAALSDVVLLRGDGNGSLSAREVLFEPDALSQPAFGDLDGDGDLDLVGVAVSLTAPDREELLSALNPGTGAFAQPRRFAVGGGVDPVGQPTFGDVDGDGDLDVGLPLYGPLDGNPNDNATDRWALLRNDGIGGFAAPEVYPAGAGIFDLAFAQLDGAGGPEAVTVAGDDDRLSVHYNEAGQYRSPRVTSVDDPRTPTFGNEPLDLASGDVNADGRPDLAVVTDSSRLLDDGPDTLALLYGTAAGLAAAPTVVDLPEGPSRVVVEPVAGSAADDVVVIFTGDALPGAVLPPGVGLALGRAQNDPAPLAFADLNGLPGGVATADLDSDGIRDLAVLRIREEGLTAGITVLTVAADGQLTPAGTLVLGSDDVLAGDVRLPEVLAAGDLDGDGRRDLVAVTWRSLGPPERVLTVLRNNGDLTFSLVGEFETVARTVTDLLLADVTGDGRPDAVLTTVASLTDADPNGSLEILVNQGDGRLGTGTGYDVGHSPVRVRATQFDGVAGLDLAVACDGSNEVTILLNDGTGAFPRQERYLTGGGTDALAVLDADGDGDPDVAVANDQHDVADHHGTVSVLLNRATGAAAATADLAVTLADAPDPVAVGATLTYTATVTNQGPDPATGVTLSATLPAGAGYAGAVPDQGTCTVNGATATCALGTLQAGNAVTVTLTLTPAAAGTLTCTATAAANEADPVAANDQASESTTVQPADGGGGGGGGGDGGGDVDGGGGDGGGGGGGCFLTALPD